MKQTLGTLFVIYKGQEVIRIWVSGQQPYALNRLHDLLQFQPDSIARCGGVAGTTLGDFLQGKRGRSSVKGAPEFVIYEKGHITSYIYSTKAA